MYTKKMQDNETNYMMNEFVKRRKLKQCQNIYINDLKKSQSMVMHSYSIFIDTFMFQINFEYYLKKSNQIGNNTTIMFKLDLLLALYLDLDSD